MEFLLYDDIVLNRRNGGKELAEDAGNTCDLGLTSDRFPDKATSMLRAYLMPASPRGPYGEGPTVTQGLVI